MKKCCLSVITIVLLAYSTLAQTTRQWTENDRKYLLDNLVRSRDLLLKETRNLTPEQWNFKEAPDRWSINQVVEHISFYELLYQREINMALRSGPQPDSITDAKPDSVYVGYIMEEKPHVTTEFTKPFTFSVPMGLNDGKNNIAWYTKMRNESIDYIKSTTDNLRTYTLKAGRPNIHQLYIYVYGHTDRHLRQIQKIKQHPNYPK